MKEELEQLGDLVFFGQNGENPEIIIVIEDFCGDLDLFFDIVREYNIKFINVLNNVLKCELNSQS